MNTANKTKANTLNKKLFLEEEFPELNPKKSRNDEAENKTKSTILSYSEKIKITKDLLINHNKIPKGWTLLKKENLYKSLINDDMIKNNTEYYQNYNNENECIHLNPHYNPMKSYEIYMNREIYREEMNEMLGDISPYWNLDEFEGYESDEESDDDYEEYEEDFECNNDIY